MYVYTFTASSCDGSYSLRFYHEKKMTQRTVDKHMKMAIEYVVDNTKIIHELTTMSDLMQDEYFSKFLGMNGYVPLKYQACAWMEEFSTALFKDGRYEYEKRPDHLKFLKSLDKKIRSERKEIKHDKLTEWVK